MQFFDNIFAKSNEDFDTLVAMILCDLDELKFMNDMYGHKKGDELIKEAANLLKRVFSDIAVVSRVGGDEFAILLIDRGKGEVESLCELLKEEIILHNSHEMGPTSVCHSGMLTVYIPKGIWIAYSWKRIKKCIKINGEEKN
ncbi:GGDEF domain-containing protein [Peribacillus simplex]|uniref:GGDEF domain-containing protein n=1 Tax=Peribacillus simplex TaxID=1478 RepID=UPI00298D804F|nr:GGDEF domain-containing protein [Peribacillus simplex]MDW7616069.1 GGDEF domain-containing protein [Peribacillus simplex]